MKCQSYDEELVDEIDDMEEPYEEERYFPYKWPVFEENYQCRRYLHEVRLKYAGVIVDFRNPAKKAKTSARRCTLLNWDLGQQFPINK